MRRASFTGCLVSMLLLAAVPSIAADKGKPSADPQEKPLEAAMLLMVQGHSAEASAAVDPILAAYDAQYATEKRQIYCAASPEETIGYMLRAAAMQKAAIAITPGWCGALFTKGFTLVDQKQVELGVSFLKRAVEMRPDYAHYLNELAYAYGALRQWTDALVAYGKAADAADPTRDLIQKTERSRAWRGMGYVLVEQGKWDEADEMYRKCLKLDPNDAKAKAELQYIAQNRPKTS